jgi:IMP dehydrogenase
MPQGMAPEGESTFVNVKGHVADVIHELCGGIRSGMSYVNAVSIEEVKQKALFMEMSANGISESRAHGVKN